MGSTLDFRRAVDPLRSTPARILIVEDAITTREMLSRHLRARGYEVIVANPDEAVRRLRTDDAELVILNLAGTSGLTLVDTLRRAGEVVPLLVISDAGPLHGGLDFTESGDALILRPFEERQLDDALARALGPRAAPGPTPRATLDPTGPVLLGDSARMAEIRALIARVADTDVTVIICGESGTGKEITARALRQASLRRDKPFIKVNCAALPTELLESELFGHEKGAFTGAHQAKPGRFELAHQGTIFLDEIGEMSPLLQAKLLQVLQDGEFSRLGSGSDVHVDVRVIAATNKDLKRAVAEGHFREDLYFRLNVVSISLPPLREHKSDIPLLADHFLYFYGQRISNRPLVRLGAETRRLFLEYDWPGNVRELENVVKRIMVLGTELPIQRELREACAAPAAAPSAVASLTEEAPRPPPQRPSLKEIGRLAAREAERAAILGMLERTRWNRKEAAEILGISYKALLYKIKENHLDESS
jgi:two-component system response regulator AtoC